MARAGPDQGGGLGAGGPEPQPSDDDFAALQRRINEARRRPKLPLLVLEAVLPRQRLRFSSKDAALEHFAELSEVGVVGSWRGRPLRHGVIATIKYLGLSNWEVHGQQHITVVGAAEPVDGMMMVKVERVEDAVQEADVQVAESLAVLAEAWGALVRSRGSERHRGQLERILAELGPMPAAEDAGDLSLWVAALVDPLPAWGGAPEVRAAVLAATSVSERLRVVLEGIRVGIKQMSGGVGRLQ